MADSPGDEFRRRQQDLARQMAAAMPDLNKTIAKILAQNLEAAGAASSFARIASDAFRFSEMMPKIEVPVPKFDTSALFPNLDKMTESINRSLAPAMNGWFDAYRDQFADLAKSLRKIAEAQYPPNWLGDEIIELPDNLETLLLDEGLPLAWVPPRPVLEKVFEASTAGDRRRVLSDNWRGIVAACLEQLKSIDEPELHEYAEFAVEAAESLRDGRWRASQALSANLMDSILHRSFDKASKKKLTDQKTRIDWENYPIRPALVLGGIWGSYSEYWASNGDPIPRRYTRHASAHGVSRRQYTRLNSVVALMHVVGLLKVIESDLA